jgi:S1-C subfamily serine protease
MRHFSSSFICLLGLFFASCTNRTEHRVGEVSVPTAIAQPDSPARGAIVPIAVEAPQEQTRDTQPTPKVGPTITVAPSSTVPPRIVNGTSVNYRPAPTARPVPEWSEVVLRLEFSFPEKRVRHAGTGFVIKDVFQGKYLLTCAHLIDQEEWYKRDRLQMRTMNGKLAIETVGAPLLIGTSVNLKKAMPNGRPDMTQDLVVQSITAKGLKSLPMARKDPQVGDWVWAVGCEINKPIGNEHLYPGRVVEVSRGGYLFEQYERFNPHGFSGGPVVNARGEVVGNVLAGGEKIVGGATVNTIRQRLREKGIILD